MRASSGLPTLLVTLIAAVCLGGPGAGAEKRRRTRHNLWSLSRTPAEGPARAIGSYRAGCLQGGVRLAAIGVGYKLMGARRRHRFGHPTLIDFVTELGAAAASEGLAPLRVGDLSMARGGPSPRFHASHQTGLDVDIYYAPPGRKLADTPTSMVDTRTGVALARWKGRIDKVLRLAAADERVERILVNPAIKRDLCESAEGDRAWLSKLQPWWGHRRHFHVQLACPKGSPECVPRTPVLPGDGCEDVSWWFQHTSRGERQALHRDYRTKIGGSPELPASCHRLVAPTIHRVAGLRERRRRRRGRAGGAARRDGARRAAPRAPGPDRGPPREWPAR